MLDGLYTNHALFMFDIVIDTDIGLLEYIKEEYNNEKYFYQGIFELSLEEKEYLFTQRTSYNPISIFFIDEKDIKSMDELYDQFITEKYEEILNRSTITGIFALIQRFTNTNTIIVSILCKNELEKNALLYFFDKYNIDESKINIEVCEDITELDLSIYDTYYVKYYSDILRFLPLEAKNIIVADVEYNKIKLNNERVLNPAISIQLVEQNEVTTISLYSFEEDVIGMG